MTKPARRRASKTSAVFVIAALLFIAGMAGSTFAYFDGSGANTGTFPGGYVFPPVTVTTLGAVTGPVQTIKWAQPTTTGVNDYELRVTNMGTSAVACPTQNVTVTLPTSTLFTTQSTTTAPTTTLTATSTVTQPVTYPETVATLAAPALTAPATVPTADNGYFVCYQAASAYSLGGWYSPPVNANGTAARAGLWATGVAESNVITKNSLANTDFITITYNQAVAASGTVTVCAFSAGVLIFGDQGGCASTGDSYSVGKLTGLSIASNASYTGTISKPTATTVKIVLSAANPAGADAITTGGTWHNGGTVVSSVGGSPNLNPCTQASCDVTPSGNF